VRAKAGLTVIAIVVLAGACRATAAVPAPQHLEHGREIGPYALVGNGAGNRVVVVSRDLLPDPSGLDVFSTAPGTEFGAVTRLRAKTMPVNPVSADVGPDGTVAIVGLARSFPKPDDDRLRAVVRDPGGSFTRPRAISSGQVGDASVAFDRQGVAMAIWTRYASKGDAAYVEQSTRPPGGPWSKPTRIAYERRGAHAAQVAFDAAGGALAVWSRDGSPIEAEPAAAGHAKRRRFETEIVAASRAPGAAAWLRPQVLSDPRFDSDEASVSVNSAGQAAVSWVLNTRGDKHFRVGAAFREPGKRFGPPRFLTPDGRDSYGQSIALDEQGRTLVVWTIEGVRPDQESDANQVVGAIRPPGGPLGKPVKLSDRHTGFPEMAMSPDGQALVTWIRESRKGFLVQARRVTTGGTYGPITPVSKRGYADDLDAIVDDDGSALVTWMTDAHPGLQLEAVGLAQPNGYDRRR
jgi:hypothetical protein